MGWRDGEPVGGPASGEAGRARWASGEPIAAADAGRSREERELAQRDAKRRKLQGGLSGGLSARLTNGFAFGLGDEASGVASMLSNAIVAPLRKDVDFEPGKAFERGRGEYNRDMAAAAKEAPAAAGVADVAGIVGSIASPVSYVARIRGLGGAVRAGARQGAITGAIAGAGNAEGGYVNRLAAAGMGAGVGLAAGAALPVVARAAGKSVQAVRRVVGAGNAPSVAPQMIADALTADGLSPRQAGRIVDEAQARGVPLALADVGDNARGLAASVGRQPGPSRTITRDMAISRQEGQADRLATAVARDLGPVANPREVSEALQQQAKAAAAPLYAEAYAAPTPITDGLASILKRIPGGAVENAKRVARLEGRDPNSLGVTFDDAGDIVLQGKPSVETLDFIKRGLDDVVERYRDKTTGRLQLDGEGRAINNLLREFVAEVDRVNPAYAAARAAYAGPVRAAAALNKGSSFANKTADDITAETRDLSAFELDQYRLGVRSAITGLIESKGDYANKVATLVGTPKKRAALARLFGGQGEFDRFLATLADEGRAAQTYGAVATGSPTAGRLADDAATADAGLIDAAGNAVVTTAAGRPVTAIINALRDAWRYGQGEAGKVARAEIAAALSETDPVILAEALRRARLARVETRGRSRINGRSTASVGTGAGIASGSYVQQIMAPGQK